MTASARTSASLPASHPVNASRHGGRAAQPGKVDIFRSERSIYVDPSGNRCQLPVSWSDSDLHLPAALYPQGRVAILCSSGCPPSATDHSLDRGGRERQLLTTPGLETHGDGDMNSELGPITATTVVHNTSGDGQYDLPQQENDEQASQIPAPAHEYSPRRDVGMAVRRRTAADPVPTEASNETVPLEDTK